MAAAAQKSGFYLVRNDWVTLEILDILVVCDLPDFPWVGNLRAC